MGIFSEWQPQYAERGIATFPVIIDGKDKRPAVRGWQKVGSGGSRDLAARFEDCNAFGINLKANRLVVLDVDTSDERVLSDALERYGQTPFVVRTGSGHYQAWYRSSGERRSIRPDKGTPIDILGDGFAVGAPSLGTKGRYTLLSGDLDSLTGLPAMKATKAEAAPAQRSEQGRRNTDLFAACMKAARQCRNEGELIEYARDYSASNLTPPLPDSEVLSVAHSAWGYETAGRNKYGRGREVHLPHSLISQYAAANPDALALLLILKTHHWGRDQFALAKPMAAEMRWTLPRWKAARAALVTMGEIECVHPGGSRPNDPPLYRWASMGCDIVPQ